jgi:hypothetical protein
MGEMTLVTAFFDIGRENYQLVPRSNETYFKRWLIHEINNEFLNPKVRIPTLKQKIKKA